MSSPFPIPIVDLRAQYRQIENEIHAAVEEILQNQSFILGPAVARFEERMAAYLGCPATVGVASGSDALLLALMALGIGPGDGVLVPTFTFFSTVSSITRLGAAPFFLDIDPESYLITPKTITEFIDRHCHRDADRLLHSASGVRIRVILPVHLFGCCAAMAEIAGIAQKHHLRIVEDVAQACGARCWVSGRQTFAGTIGNLGCFSFFPSKTLGAYGDGGLVATASQHDAERLRILRMHGERTKYYHEVIGINSRLDSLQAAILTVKLQYLDRWCEQRIERAATYDRLFRDAGLLGDGILGIPRLGGDRSHVFNNYVIRAQRRDQLKVHLAARAIQSEIYYPLPLHLQPCFAGWGHREGDFPEAETASREVLALPIYPELSATQQESVVNNIAQFYRQ